ncbi:TRAFAC clade GTPase domain-containing protein [Kineococcus sp. SYSU DK005]|uniref:TRAFAC clade GTPase domain-containing protein n=1 Tax=Kineococcus sp. SYSU DK005 TaxID=3383126 RepID=UPI003D7C75C0
MGYLIVFFIGLYLALLVLWFSFAVLAPLAGAVAAVIAGVLVLVEYASASSGVFAGSAPIDRIGVEPSDDPRRRHDSAYRSYFLGPVLRDYQVVVQTATRHSWARVFSSGSSGDPRAGWMHRERGALMSQVLSAWGRYDSKIAKLLLAGPIVGGAVGLAAGAAAAGLLTAVISIVFWIVLLLVVAAAATTAFVLRIAETISLRVRGITLECPSCHERIAKPAYLCAHCPPHRPTMHRNLVPGTLGVFRRTCRCGNSLPTLLAGGKWKLAARCQREQCNAALPTKVNTTPTFHVPVVAGTAAGKTVFMMAATARLESQARSSDGDLIFEFADEGAKQQYVAARKALENASLNRINPTLPGVSLRAYTVYLGGAGMRKRLLYLYDSAGERFEHRSGLDHSNFLALTRGVVFIIDPFALDSIRRLAGSEVLENVTASVVEPEDVFSRFGQALREALKLKPGRKFDASVSVVITKADALLRSPSVPHPYESLHAEADAADRAAYSAAARRWLIDVGGQRSLVALIENSFTYADYFVVSALDAFTVTVRRSGRAATGVKNDDPSAPVTWLLGQGRRRA